MPKQPTPKSAAKQPPAKSTSSTKKQAAPAAKKSASASPSKTAAKAPAKKAPEKKVAVKAATPAKKAPAPAAKKAPAAPAKKAKKAVLDKWTQEQYDLLQHERETYTHQAESLKAEADQLAMEMEPGDVQFDEESGEGGTMNVERERDLALSAQARQAVEEIDRALEKIEEGSYGVCERCGQPIAKARLKAIPQASLCVPCKSGGLLRR